MLMADRDRMIAAARRALLSVLGLEASDRVLVVLDPPHASCGEAFVEAARAEGCVVTEYWLPEHGRPLTTMPEGMAARVEGIDVVVNAISGSSDEVPFRIEWLTLVEGLGLRMGHSPGITEEMMDGGPMDVDYGLMAGQARRLMDALRDAASAAITAPGGTDITIGLSGRRFTSDVTISEDHTSCNLPCGEVFCAPLEDGANGVLVADGPIGGEGPPPSPVTIRVEGGRAVAVSCADPSWQRRITQLLDTDEGARTIAELGIGLNPGARLVGKMLEDEKALRTAHIAFGSNIGLPCGTHQSRTHIDYLFHRPTIVVAGEDGSKRTILEDGEIEV
jgi:hypothetical protein